MFHTVSTSESRGPMILGRPSIANQMYPRVGGGITLSPPILCIRLTLNLAQRTTRRMKLEISSRLSRHSAINQSHGGSQTGPFRTKLTSRPTDSAPSGF